MQTVIGVFNNPNDAGQAQAMLEKMGYSPHEISITKNSTEQLVGTKGGSARRSSRVIRGMVVGGVAGLLLGVAVVNIPGIGTFSASNPLTALLGLSGTTEVIATSTLLGAVMGLVLGALLGLGTNRVAIPYQQPYGQSVVLAVPATVGDHADYVRDILEQHHAGQIRSIMA